MDQIDKPGCPGIPRPPAPRLHIATFLCHFAIPMEFVRFRVIHNKKPHPFTSLSIPPEHQRPVEAKLKAISIGVNLSKQNHRGAASRSEPGGHSLG
jgi:hypothetical protein